MNLSAPFINRPVMTTLVMLALIFFGIFAYRLLPVSDLPNIDYPTITVTASQPGGSPEYMADLVATPLERNFASISGLSMMASNSTLGLTQIVLNFELDVDLSSKEVEVQAAITQSLPDLPPLPNNPTFEKSNPSDTPILFLVLTSPFQPLSELYEVGYNILAQPLSMIDGVSKVQVYGDPYAVRVQADPMKLMSHKTDLNELALSLVNSNPNLPSGSIQGRYRDLIIETKGMLTTGEGYNGVVIREVEKSPLYVENVAKGVSGLKSRNPYFHYIEDSLDENMVVIAISRLPGSNTIEITDTIFKKLPELKKAIPGSLNLSIFYDKAGPIITSVEDVEITLVIALVLVIAVIFFYLGKLFETIIPSLVLPMSIVSTFIVMYLIGFSLDNLSLLALTLAIGFVVDDAIVVMENIVRHKDMGKTAYEAAIDGSKQISITVFTMSLALSAVFIPFIWMPGILGRVFHEFSLTIVIAIFCSGFISLTLNPMLCSRYLKDHPKKEGKHFSDRMNDKLVGWYEWLLVHSIRYKKTTLFVGIFSIFFAYLMVHLLPTDFLPPGNLDIVQGLTQCQEGSSSTNTIRHQKEANEIVKAYPYQEKFLSLAGYPTDDQGLFYIRLMDPKNRPTSSEIVTDLSKKLSVIPGMNVYLKTFPLINLQVGTSSSIGDYQYTLMSPDGKSLYEASELLLKKLKEIPEILGVNTDMRVNSPQLRVSIDRDRAGIYGVTAEEIESTLQFAYSGGRISTFSRGINLYDLIVEVQPGYDLVAEDLDLLYIKSSTTQQLIPLNTVATWKEVVAPSSVSHINTFPAVTFSFNLAPGATLGDVLKKIDAAGLEVLPENVLGKVQGSAQVFLDTFKSMTWLLALAVLVIYLLLGILYESFIHPLTILSGLPVAVLGGLLTLWIFNLPLSLYSVVGMIVLIGLVQKNGIMMVDFALEYLQKPGETSYQAILEACKARFRPIIMTTLAAMMGALPIAIGIGDNGETNRPLGLVIFGGLLFSQLITLFVTPVVFLYMQALQDKLSRRKESIK